MVTLSRCPVSESTKSKPTSPRGRQSELRESASALATAPTRSSASAVQKRRFVSVEAGIVDPVVLNGQRGVVLYGSTAVQAGRQGSRERHHGFRADTSSPRSGLV